MFQACGRYVCRFKGFSWPNGEMRWMSAGAVTTNPIQVGDKASTRKTFTKEDLEKFKELTLDANRVHFDEEYMKTTKFGQVLVHGTLTLGFLAGIMGCKLPGPGTLALGIQVEFPAPCAIRRCYDVCGYLIVVVFVGEPVEGTIEVIALTGRKAEVSLSGRSLTSGKEVLRGRANLLIPKK